MAHCSEEREIPEVLQQAFAISGPGTGCQAELPRWLQY